MSHSSSKTIPSKSDSAEAGRATNREYELETDGEKNETPISEKDGIESAKRIFSQSDANNAKDVDHEEKRDEDDREFRKFLAHRQKAQELGLYQPAIINNFHQGGVHMNNSHVNNSGNLVGNDQTTSGENSTPNLQDHTPEASNADQALSVETVFDNCEDIEQRSFMIAIAAFSDFNYRTVTGISKQLFTILQPPEPVPESAENTAIADPWQ